MEESVSMGIEYLDAKYSRRRLMPQFSSQKLPEAIFGGESVGASQQGLKKLESILRVWLGRLKS
jgi:hypothetical protein